MYSFEEYKKLAEKYGQYSSWAIWDENDSYNTKVIEDNIKELNSNFVILGLNISRILKKEHWTNFHDNTHARKLRYACNNSFLRGSYITDIFKDLPEANSAKLKNILTDVLIKDNVGFFAQEMRDIKINENTRFIVLGGLTKKYFDLYFKPKFNNKCIYFDHYSAYGKYTDKEWVIKLQLKLKIYKKD